MAHQIRQLFQYQEEKQRTHSWESGEDLLSPSKDKKDLAGQIDLSAEQLYLEHKSKLVRTRVQRQGKDSKRLIRRIKTVASVNMLAFFFPP